MRLLKVRFEEVIIGALLGLGAALAVLSPLILLTHLPMPSLLSVVWPFSLPGDEPDRWARLPHVLVSVGGWGGVILGGWLAARQTEEQHVRGMRYVAEPGAAADALQAIETRRMSPQQKAHKVHGVTIGGVEWSRSRETEHALVLGLPLPGKPQSTTTRDLMASSEVFGALLVVHATLGQIGEHVTVASIHDAHVLRRMHADEVEGLVQQ